MIQYKLISSDIYTLSDTTSIVIMLDSKVARVYKIIIIYTHACKKRMHLSERRTGKVTIQQLVPSFVNRSITEPIGL